MESQPNSDEENLSLSNPATRGEDLAKYGQRTMELAPIYCGDCENLHLLQPSKRAANRAAKTEVDASYLMDVIGRLVADRGTSGPIDIVVAGSADTRLLSTCAHAAFVNAREAFSRVQFTVLDRCRTPLEICRVYAEQHGLPLTIDAVDLTETNNSYPADILFQHSLFRFLPRDRHVATLKKFRDWLKPGGRMIFSTSVKPPRSTDRLAAFRSRSFGRLTEKVDAGSINFDEPRENLDIRVGRHLKSADANKAEFENLDMVRQLFASAGMSIESLKEISQIAQLEDGQQVTRERVVAVLSADQ